MSNLYIKTFFIFVMILMTSGCAHVVSQGTRSTVDADLSPEELFKNPDLYKGKIVILGGVIIHSRNMKEGTYIEVLQKPVNSRGIPRDTDSSLGRFIVMTPGFVDPAVFSQGRAITVAGEVLGKKQIPLDEIEYSYVLLKSKELHLTEKSYASPVHIGIGVGVGGSF